MQPESKMVRRSSQDPGGAGGGVAACSVTGTQLDAQSKRWRGTEEYGVDVMSWHYKGDEVKMIKTNFYF